MEFNLNLNLNLNLLHILIFLSLALVASHADVSPEAYWKSVLPNSPMPKAVTDLLHSEWNEDKSTSVGIGKGGITVHAPGTNVGIGKGGVSVHAPGTNVGVGKGGHVSVHAPGTKVGAGKGGGVSVHAPGTNVGVGKGGVSVHAPGTNVGVRKGGVSVHAPGTNVGVGKGGGVSVNAPGTHVGVSKGGVSVHAPGTNVGVGKGGVSVHAPGTNVGVGKDGTSVHVKKPEPKCSDISIGNGGIIVHCDPKGKPVNVVVGSPFLYKYAANDDQLKDDPNVALFFQEKDLHQGTNMNLHFTKTTSPSVGFLPRNVADTIPFSSNKLPEIYDHFSVKPDSSEAKLMKKTINECEDKGLEGEEKYCATSLESMVDFSTSKLGKKVKAVSTQVKSKGSTLLQKYKIIGTKKLAADKAVVCHKQNYAYAVFYCHKTTSTRAYSVSLVGEDGTKAEAVAVCHTDTAKWNPKHLAFRALKVKPGTVPVCHFLPEDHIVWVPY